MKLTLSRIDGVLWQGDAQSVTVPAVSGEMTILSHHMPMVTTLRKGAVSILSQEGERIPFAIESGFIEIGKEETVILV